VECRSDADCGPRDRGLQCLSDGNCGCSGDTVGCEHHPAGPRCRKGGVPYFTYSRCGCTSDEDCPGSTCDEDTTMCKQHCKSNADCAPTLGMHPSEKTPFCNKESSVCVDCDNDGHSALEGYSLQSRSRDGGGMSAYQWPFAWPPVSRSDRRGNYSVLLARDGSESHDGFWGKK
jgi:hypothetical protein